MLRPDRYAEIKRLASGKAHALKHFNRLIQGVHEITKLVSLLHHCSRLPFGPS